MDIRIMVETGRDTPANNTGKTPVPKSRRPLRVRIKRLFFKLIVLTGILLFIAALLPTWINTEQGRVFLLNRINHHIHGRLAVDHWTLGWFSGIQASGIVLSSSDNQPVIACQSLRSDLTLWSVLTHNFDGGNTRFTGLVVQLEKQSDSGTNLSHIFSGGSGAVNSGDSPAQSWKSWVQSVRGVIELDNTELVLKTAHGQLRLTGVNAKIEMATAATPVRVDLLGTGVSGNQAHTVELHGVFPPARDWFDQPLALLQSVDFHGGAFAVAPLLDWLNLDTRILPLLGPDVKEINFVSSMHDSIYEPNLQLRSTQGSFNCHALIESCGTPVRSEGAFSGFCVVLPNDPAYTFQVSLGMSQPLRDLLNYINPLFAQSLGDAGIVNCTVSEGKMPLVQPAGLTATALLEFPGMQVQPKGTLNNIMAAVAARGIERPVKLDIPPLLVHIADARISYDNLVLNFSEQTRLAFSGQIGFDRSLNLLLAMKIQNPGNLTATAVQMPIWGTIDSPQINTGSLPKK